MDLKVVFYSDYKHLEVFTSKGLSLPLRPSVIASTESQAYILLNGVPTGGG